MAKITTCPTIRVGKAFGFGRPKQKGGKCAGYDNQGVLNPRCASCAIRFGKDIDVATRKDGELL